MSNNKLLQIGKNAAVEAYANGASDEEAEMAAEASITSFLNSNYSNNIAVKVYENGVLKSHTMNGQEQQPQIPMDETS